MKKNTNFMEFLGNNYFYSDKIIKICICLCKIVMVLADFLTLILSVLINHVRTTPKTIDQGSVNKKLVI